MEQVFQKRFCCLLYVLDPKILLEYAFISQQCICSYCCHYKTIMEQSAWLQESAIMNFSVYLCTMLFGYSVGDQHNTFSYFFLTKKILTYGNSFRKVCRVEYMFGFLICCSCFGKLRLTQLDDLQTAYMTSAICNTFSFEARKSFLSVTELT